MSHIGAIFIIIISMVLVDNYPLAQFLGICPFLGVSKDLDSAKGMGIAVTFVMVLATAVTWPIQRLLLDPMGIGYLQTVVFILIIAALVQFVEMFMKKSMPALYQSLGIFLPLITTNCAVLGVALNVVTKEFTFGGGPAHMLNLGQSVVYAFATAIGYGMALILFAGMREHLELNDIPKQFKGVPIALVTCGILAMAFMGFSGMV